jgi:hypothetical protein
MVLTELAITAPLQVLSLHGAALTAVGQDTWLTKCLPRDYLLTRQWAAAIRTWEPQAEGFAHRCRHDEDELAWVLFTSPRTVTHPGLAVIPGQSYPLDEPLGQTILRSVLNKYNATLTRG